MHSLKSKNNENKLLLDYNDLIILYFLSKQTKSKNNTQISAETEIYYQTVIEKIKKLEKNEFVGTIKRGTHKLTKITDKGREFIKNWAQSAFGKELKDEFEDLLRKKKS